VDIQDPEAVGSTRCDAFNVFNGGFAQAAYNIPDWFELAAVGYERLGRPMGADRIRQATELALTEHARVSWLKRRLA